MRWFPKLGFEEGRWEGLAVDVEEGLNMIYYLALLLESNTRRDLLTEVLHLLWRNLA